MTASPPGQSKGNAVNSLAKLGTAYTMIVRSSMLTQAPAIERKATTPQ
jgi:hypothetical protein